MEKLGVENKDLLADLQKEYNELKAHETEMAKHGSGIPRVVKERIAEVKSRMDALREDA